MDCAEREKLNDKYMRSLAAYVKYEDELKLPGLRDWTEAKKMASELHWSYMTAMQEWIEHRVKHGC